MVNKEVKLSELFNTIVERQQMYSKSTATIAELIQPTILDAICEVLDATPPQLELLNIDLYQDHTQAQDQSTLLITCLITYDHAEDVPLLLLEIAPLEDDDTQDPTKRTIRMAIPYSCAFDTKDDIKRMLLNTLITGLSEDLEDDDELSEADVMSLKSTVVNMSDYISKLHKGSVH